VCSLFTVELVPSDEHESGGNGLLEEMTIGTTYRYTVDWIKQAKPNSFVFYDRFGLQYFNLCCVSGDIHEYVNHPFGKLSYRLNIDRAHASAREDILINTDTGALQANPSSEYTAFVQILAVDDRSTVVLQNWTFTARPADIANVTNGPNGKGCENGDMVDTILYDDNFGCTCYHGFSGANCELSDGLPRLQVVVYNTAQSRSDNSTSNGIDYAGRDRMQWAIKKTYRLPPVLLFSASTSDGKAIDVESIQFVLDHGPPGFFIDGRTGELMGKPKEILSTTVATLYATYVGTTKAKLWDLSFQFLADDRANNAHGPNGEGCGKNGIKIDEVEFDNSFTCHCNTGYNVTASANCNLRNVGAISIINTGAIIPFIIPFIAVIAVVVLLVIVWRVIKRRPLSVELPADITTIKDWAFSDISNLTTIIIPPTVTSIGRSAFNCCSNLTSIDIPPSVTSIGDHAFQRCFNLTAITISPSVKSIGKSAFYECTNLTTINIPPSVTTIGDGAFRHCYNLTSINIPPAVKSVGDYAFYACSNLTTMTIPPSVTLIGYCAFYDCSNLTTINIPNSVISIGVRTFNGCKNLATINIPPSVISIGNHAFNGCSNLTTITIPPSVKTIQHYAFNSCTNLISVAFPESDVPESDDPESAAEINTEINTCNYAFLNCKRLQFVAAPAHIVNNPRYIFNKCPMLDNGKKGVVLTTPATRLQVLRIQYFHPSTMSYLYRPEQRDFATNLMMIGDRINSTSDSPFPPIPNEVMLLILRQLRIHDLGPSSE